MAELFHCFYLYDVDLRSEEVSSNRSLPVHRSQSDDGKPTQCKKEWTFEYMHKCCCEFSDTAKATYLEIRWDNFFFHLTSSKQHHIFNFKHKLISYEIYAVLIIEDDEYGYDTGIWIINNNPQLLRWVSSGMCESDIFSCEKKLWQTACKNKVSFESQFIRFQNLLPISTMFLAADVIVCDNDIYSPYCQVWIWEKKEFPVSLLMPVQNVRAHHN